MKQPGAAIDTIDERALNWLCSTSLIKNSHMNHEVSFSPKYVILGLHKVYQREFLGNYGARNVLPIM